MSLEYQQLIEINFIDFQKAFDSVYPPSLWKILRLYGIPAHYIKFSKLCTINEAAAFKLIQEQGTWNSLK